MIEFVSDDEVARVKVTVLCGTAGQCTFHADHQCGNKWYAGLLAKQWRQEACVEMQRIRREAYEAGWRDAKSKKRPKKDWFSGALP